MKNNYHIFVNEVEIREWLKIIQKAKTKERQYPLLNVPIEQEKDKQYRNLFHTRWSDIRVI